MVTPVMASALGECLVGRISPELLRWVVVGIRVVVGVIYLVR